MKNATQIEQLLHEYRPYLNTEFSVTSLHLFGSYARHQQTLTSDIDLLVEFEQTPSLFEFIRLEEFLSEILDCKVDLGMQDTLKPRLRDKVLNLKEGDMTRDYGLYVEDILVAINKIEAYTQDMSYSEFCQDGKTIDAVIRNFEIIGGAAKQIPDEMRTQHPHIPWSRMAGMRDRLIHGYFTTKLAVVWQVVKEEVADLIPLLQKMLQEIDDEQAKPT